MPKSSIQKRLKNRLDEMISRRKKLLKTLCKKELLAGNYTGNEGSGTIQAMIDQKEKQKSSLLENFNVGYLEEMLKSTTKSIAKDVVSTLINTEKSGVLVNMQKRDKNSKGASMTAISGAERSDGIAHAEGTKMMSGMTDAKSQGVVKTTKPPQKMAGSHSKISEKNTMKNKF